MTDKLLTIAEIAAQLKMPESTIRYYRDKYLDFIPYKGKGRNRRYKPEAIDVFRSIAECMEHNLTQDQVEERLTAEFTRSIDVPQERNPQTSTEQQTDISADLMTMNAAVMEIKQSMMQLAVAMSAMNQQQQEIAELRKMVQESTDRERQLSERLEKLESESKRSWLQRIFGK